MQPCEDSCNASMPSAQVSKAVIVGWINDSFRQTTAYTCIKEVPAKAAAKLLHAMLGPATCPLSNIQFRDASDQSVRLQNCTEVLLHLAPAAGYTGGLTPQAWLSQSKFSEMLKFWRFMYLLHADHPLPADFDPTLEAAGQTHCGVAAAAPPSARHAGSGGGATASARTTAEKTSCEEDPDDDGEAVCYGRGAPGAWRGHAEVLPDAAAPPIAATVDSLLEPGKENERCPSCKPFVAKAIEKDMKRLRALHKAHQDLISALRDRDVARVAFTLESV